MIRLLFALLTALTLLPGLAQAHALDPGYLELTPLSEDSWRVTWRAPDVSGHPMPLTVRLPESCSGAPAAAPVFDGRAWVSGWIASCPEGLAGGTIRIEGLEATATDTLVRYELTPGQTRMQRLTAAATAFEVPAQAGTVEILASYVSLGFSHILEGLDHLLFVFAMLLLVPTYKRLFWAVTAFTLAHSLTLAASSLGLLRIPSPPVEAVIALSIVFLAYELCLPAERRDPLTMRAPWLVSFTFGLIHGLGFAGALREIGLPEGDIPLALFSFNLGVELGQLFFIAIVLLVGAVLRLILPLLARHAERFRRGAGYAIGSISAFWLIERIAGF
ncbi:HupE/UreJ family protein [Salipiger bermudensis]|uniref:HupE/UreJ family protein n=1 Tax=Salipiger bermudensis TaxID=344736 RepID=UPI001C99C4D1|nr:HupE/UreJ family protein [Salipiger bermudensis]MBY6006138.1 HupE/UreJ family protein [Salipiger bermudensis]